MISEPDRRRIILQREQPEEFAVEAVCDLAEIFYALLKMDVVAIDNHQISFIILNPILIALIQPLQVVTAYSLFILPGTFLDMPDQRWH